MSVVSAIRSALVASALLVAVSAHADGKDACKADVVKFCDEVLPGGGRILVCLEAHERELSAGCQEQLAAGRRMGACKADAEKFCKGVQPGKGRILECLKSHEADLSPDCMSVMAKQHGH